MIIKTSFTKAVAASMVILIGSVMGAAAATFTVTNTNDSGPGSLRQAVLSSNTTAGSDTIVFDSSFGTTRTITLANTIFIDPATGDSLTITGPGANLLRVSGNNAVQIFFVNSGDTASFSGMTLTQGRNNNGGAAIDNRGSLSVSNVAFTSNFGNNAGGAIVSDFGTTLNITNSSFTSNSSAAGSSAIDNNGSLTVTNTTFASGIGGLGAISNSRTMTITGCAFTNNISNGGGATATGGGAIYSANPAGGVVTVADSTFTGNSTTNSQSGGAIVNREGTMNITNSTFTNNTSAIIGGGAISSSDVLNISGSTFTSNSTSGPFNNNASTGRGGAIFSFGQLSIANSVITGNSATIDGGGIFYVAAGTAAPSLIITNSTVSNNTANSDRDYAGDGGGIYLRSEAGLISISSSTISGNTVNTNTVPLPSGPVSFGNGGGVFSETRLTIDNSTISGNAAATSGGGIYDSYTGGSNSQFMITNSTIVNNTATGNGGGIRSSNSVGDTPTSLRNTIVANNIANGGTSQDVLNPILSQGYNLIRNTAGTTITGTTTGNITGVDPLLGGLENNGGPTKTHALLNGSPAIDKGKSFGTTTDQRGFLRPFDDPSIANAAGGDGSDIGAYEANALAPTSLGNISTRLRVETGDNVLFGGFFVTGTQPKRLIVRAIGPSLNGLVPDALQNPTLELYSGQTLIASNDNWVDASNKQEIIDSTLAPKNDFESAILTSLAPGAYTAIVRGVNGTTGVGLVELYDLGQTADSKLAQISTRGFVQTGDNVMFGGFFVLSGSQKVIIRAIGPSLPVNGKLADPTMELRDGNGALLEANDNWVDSPNKQAIIDSTVPPTNNSESAILRTLTPGPYTAIVRGVNNTTGIALVEVYALK